MDHSEQITWKHFAAPPSGFWPLPLVYLHLRDRFGLVDTCDGPHPRFIRPDGWANPIPQIGEVTA